eukprot:scaffold4466_cov200-Ochromonas_danica.AAC.1
MDAAPEDVFPSKLCKAKIVQGQQAFLKFYEFEQFILFLLNEVEDHHDTVENALANSFLYRFYMSFLHNHPKDSFAVFVIQYNNTGLKVNTTREYLHPGDDIAQLVNDLRCLRATLYGMAVIGGIEFRSRGWECREADPQKESRYDKHQDRRYEEEKKMG